MHKIWMKKRIDLQQLSFIYDGGIWHLQPFARIQCGQKKKLAIKLCILNTDVGLFSHFVQYFSCKCVSSRKSQRWHLRSFIYENDMNIDNHFSSHFAHSWQCQFSFIRNQITIWRRKMLLMKTKKKWRSYHFFTSNCKLFWPVWSKLP